MEIKSNLGFTGNKDETDDVEVKFTSRRDTVIENKKITKSPKMMDMTFEADESMQDKTVLMHPDESTFIYRNRENVSANTTFFVGEIEKE